VFGGMQSPIALDSPEGQEALARMQQAELVDDEPATGDASDASPSAENGLTGAKVRELLDAGLGEEQIQQLLAAEGVTPDMIVALFEEAERLSPASPPPPLQPAPPPVSPPPVAVIDPRDELYPMPAPVSAGKQIFLPFLPFGIAPGAFLISSAVVVAILGLLAYLLALTSS